LNHPWWQQIHHVDSIKAGRLTKETSNDSMPCALGNVKRFLKKNESSG
jgi:hypothetical protein